MKIRVFALAKQLGISSKRLIEWCDSSGVKVSNSALASLTQDQVNLVLSEHGHLLESRTANEVEADIEIVPPLPVTWRQRLYSQPCQQTHRQLLVGVCPWCGEAIMPLE